MAIEHPPGSISRRRLLGQGAAALVAGALGAGVAAEPPGTAGWDPGRSASSSSPRRGGHLKLGFEGGAQENVLDPGTYSTQFMQVIGYAWGNSLVETGARGELVPELAVEWSSDPSVKTWVFKLRKGVVFHNGKTLTAADVVYSLNHHRKADSRSLARGLFKEVVSIQATAECEVTITLSSGNVDFPGLLTDYRLLVFPENGDPNAGVGTGPYRLERFEAGVIATGRRNTGYWKSGRAHVDSVEILAINDVVARQSALRGRLVHFISRPDPKLGALIRRDPRFTWLDLPGAQHYVLPMRCDVEPFRNKDLRLAMKYALDREDVLSRIYSGSGQIGNDHPVPSFDPMFSPSVPLHSYDSDKARFHFARSGHSGPIDLYVSDAGFSGATETATLFKEHASRAQIDIEVHRVPADGYWSAIWRRKPFCAAYWGGRVTAGLMLQAAYTTDAVDNETCWRRPEFDALLRQAQSELDNRRRKEMFHDLQMMVWEDGGALLPLFANRLYASTSDVTGLLGSPYFTAFRAAEQLYFTARAAGTQRES